MNILEARRRTLGKGVYKKTVEGNPAIAQGSLARMYPKIEMQGWTEQNQYEGKNLFDISKVIGSDNGNLKVEGNTIVVKNAQYGQAGKDPHKFSDYFPNAEIGKTYRLDFDYINRTFIFIQGVGIWDAKQSKVMTQEILDGIVYFYSTASEENIYSNIMLNEGTTALPYEPYTGNQPSPSPEYPQEIVNAGKYNEEAQKWEYEITIANAQTDPDKNQTVTLTADRPLTKWDKLEKRNGQWGWVYKSEEIESYTDESVPGEYFSTTGQLSTGAQVWYETTTETFVPLTTAEQEAMNALYTFRPTTVLSNDCECNMKLMYKTKESMQSAPGGGYPES